MRTGRGAAVGVVTELVDVESTLSVGVVAEDVPRDSGGSVLGGLLKGDGTVDLGVTTEDSDWLLLAESLYRMILECWLRDRDRQRKSSKGHKVLKCAHSRSPGRSRTSESTTEIEILTSLNHFDVY